MNTHPKTLEASQMNSLRMAWWRFLLDLRPMLRYFAERFPTVAPWWVRVRTVSHWFVGNPLQTLTSIVGALAWSESLLPGRWFLGVVAAVHVAVAIYCRVAFDRGSWLIGWREAWRIRRRWPADWAAVAAKTSRVQAEVGTSKEPIASAVLRPIADHPKLSWLPRIEWPVVSWWVSPPPGRSFESLDELTVVLAANISHVADIELDYERENDSHGRLTVSFREVLSDTTTPSWHNPQPTVILGDLDDDELADALDAFDHQQGEPYPPLRVVNGEAS